MSTSLDESKNTLEDCEENRRSIQFFDNTLQQIITELEKLKEWLFHSIAYAVSTLSLFSL